SLGKDGVQRADALVFVDAVLTRARQRGDEVADELVGAHVLLAELARPLAFGAVFDLLDGVLEGLEALEVLEVQPPFLVIADLLRLALVGARFDEGAWRLLRLVAQR